MKTSSFWAAGATALVLGCSVFPEDVSLPGTSNELKPGGDAGPGGQAPNQPDEDAALPATSATGDTAIPVITPPPGDSGTPSGTTPPERVDAVTQPPGDDSGVKPMPSSCRSVLTLTATADAWLDATQQGNRKGESTELVVGAISKHRSLVRFRILEDPIFRTLEFSLAKLSLVTKSRTGHGKISVHRVTVDWVEDRVNWNRGTEGPDFDWVGGEFDLAPGPHALVPAWNQPNDLVTWDVTELVRDELNMIPTYGWILVDVPEGGLLNTQSVIFHSKEVDALAPTLEFFDCDEP